MAIIEWIYGMELMSGIIACEHIVLLEILKPTKQRTNILPLNITLQRG